MIRTILWSVLCVSVGLCLGGVEIRGSTPMGHLERLWNHRGAAVSEVKEGADEAVAAVKKKVTSREAPVARPTETHTVDDRNAIDQLIAHHAQK